MDSFDLKIRYPHHMDLKDVEQLEALNTIGVLTRFDKMGWKKQLSRWLQLDGASPTFTISNEAEQKSNKEDRAVIVWAEDWHEGIIFIVTGKQ